MMLLLLKHDRKSSPLFLQKAENVKLQNQTIAAQDLQISCSYLSFAYLG